MVIGVLALAMLANPVMARCWNRKKVTKLDFVVHIENPVTIEDNVRWWYDTGESGTGTPIPRPDGAMKQIAVGYQWELQGDENYLQIDGTKIPLSPEDYSCKYDIYWNYDVDFPTLQEGTYFVRETITFKSAEFKGFIKIFSVEKATIAYDPESPLGFTFEASGICFGCGRINGKVATLQGERHLVQILPTIVEDSGIIRLLRW